MKIYLDRVSGFVFTADVFQVFESISIEMLIKMAFLIYFWYKKSSQFNETP